LGLLERLLLVRAEDRRAGSSKITAPASRFQLSRCRPCSRLRLPTVICTATVAGSEPDKEVGGHHVGPPERLVDLDRLGLGVDDR
jgi:hypothetical protein